jgi:hypothetical protein
MLQSICSLLKLVQPPPSRQKASSVRFTILLLSPSSHVRSPASPARCTALPTRCTASLHSFSKCNLSWLAHRPHLRAVQLLHVCCPYLQPILFDVHACTLYSPSCLLFVQSLNFSVCTSYLVCCRYSLSCLLFVQPILFDVCITYLVCCPYLQPILFDVHACTLYTAHPVSCLYSLLI